MKVLGAFVGGVLLLVALGYASWSAVDASSILESESPPVIQVTSPSAVTVTGLSPVTVALTGVQAQSVVSPVDGLVTDLAQPGISIDAGAVVARVNDLPIIAFAGSAPVVADVMRGMQGPSVERAIAYLRALGFYSGDVSNRAGSLFQEAARRYNADVGRPADGDVLAVSGLAWIGIDGIAKFTPTVAIGTYVGAQTPLGVGDVLSASATVTEGSAIPQAAIGQRLVGEISGVFVNYEQGTGVLDQATVLALAALGRTEFATQLALPEPFDAAAVPTGAVVRDGAMACVIEVLELERVGSPVRVTILSEEPGLVMLEPKNLPSRAVANPWDLAQPVNCRG